MRGPISLRFRCLLDHDHKDKSVGCPKYLGIDLVDTRPFNTRALHEASDTIAIAEGELDAIALCASGIPAVGIPGAHGWKDHYPILFRGYDRVYVIGDGDDAGKELNRKVSRSLSNAIVVTMGHGIDVADVYQTTGSEGVRQLIER